MQPRLMGSQTESNYSRTPFTCALFRADRFIQAPLWCHADLSWGRFWCGSWQNFNMNLFILPQHYDYTHFSHRGSLAPYKRNVSVFLSFWQQSECVFGIGRARGDLRPLKTQRWVRKQKFVFRTMKFCCLCHTSLYSRIQLGWVYAPTELLRHTRQPHTVE